MIDAITTLLEHLATALTETGLRLSQNAYEVSQNALLSGADFDTLETGNLDMLSTFFNLSAFPLVAQVPKLIADIGDILKAMVDVL